MILVSGMSLSCLCEGAMKEILGNVASVYMGREMCFSQVMAIDSLMTGTKQQMKGGVTIV